MEPEGPGTGPCPEQNQSTTSHLISVSSILILSSHICLCLQSGPFPPGFLTRILYAFLISSMCVVCPTHLILLDLIILIIFGEAYKLRSSLQPVLYRFLDLINVYWQYEHAPEEWGLAAVVPMFKKCEGHNCYNYREISVLGSCFKC